MELFERARTVKQSCQHYKDENCGRDLILQKRCLSIHLHPLIIISHITTFLHAKKIYGQVIWKSKRS